MATKYESIARDLSSRIEHGEFPSDRAMPAETDLMAEYSVSLGTLRRALEALESRGQVTRVHGRGTFPRMHKPVVQRDSRRYQWEADRISETDEERRSTGATEYDTGIDTADLSFSAQYRELDAPDRIADLLEVASGARVLRRTYRTRFAPTGELLGRAESYVPIDLIQSNPDLLDSNNEPWPGGTLHQLSTVGIFAGQIEDRVSARLPLDDEVVEFSIPRSTMLLCTTKLTRDLDGRAVEVALVAWPSQKVEMTFVTAIKRPD